MLDIDNSRRIFHPVDKLDDLLHRLLPFLLRPYFIEKIGSVERRNVLIKFHKIQIANNIALYLGRGSGSKRNDRNICSYLIDHRSGMSEFWSKIMSPLIDTMSVLHNNQRNINAHEKNQ